MEIIELDYNSLQKVKFKGVFQEAETFNRQNKKFLQEAIELSKIWEKYNLILPGTMMYSQRLINEK